MMITNLCMYNALLKPAILYVVKDQLKVNEKGLNSYLSLKSMKCEFNSNTSSLKEDYVNQSN